MANTTNTNEVKETKTNEVKMVTINLPLSRTEKDDVYVAVNGDSFLIKRGVDVEVPDYVFEVLKHKEDMLMKAIAFEQKAQSKVPD